jgi:hypothetical protein
MQKSPQRKLTMSKSQSQSETSDPGVKYHVVVIPDMGEVQVISFETSAELVAGLQNLEGQSVHVIPFTGNRLRITKGPYRYLEVDGKYIALFSIPDAKTLEFDDGGYLGDQFPMPYVHDASLGEPHDEQREVVVEQSVAEEEDGVFTVDDDAEEGTDDEDDFHGEI